jgi:RNA polymerase sigma-54 factor
MGSTSDEEPMTQRKIRVIIRQFIEEEDKNAPLTDEEMTAMLKEQGYDLARRTVAKYRQQMGIPVARMRR